MGGMIDKISEEYSMGTFFLIFTFIPIGVGLISILLNPVLKRLMHGVR
jgi:POT family proton-dependent oligopeptide transporter